MYRTEEQQEKLEAALAYAKDGWHVLPLHSTQEGICTCRNKACPSKGKHPRTKNGIKDASKDANQIRAWWIKYPNANIGLVTGKISRRMVLDIDIKKGKRGDLSLAALLEEHGPLPQTLKAITASGGEHYVFQMPKKAIRSRLGVREGIDVLAEEKYFVASPSEIDGKAYRWEVDVQPAPCPEWFSTFGKKDSTPENRIAKLIKEILPIGEDRRGEWRVRCPFPPHEDRNPSFDVNLSTGVYYCHSCEKKGTIEDLYAHIKQITKEEARRIIYPPPGHIQELNQIHAVITDFGGKCVILNESEDPKTKWKKITLSSLADLRGRYRSRPLVPVGSKLVPLADAWFGDRDRREYGEIIFVPGKPTPPGYYNLWQGWPVSPRPGDCSRYLQLIHEIICRSDAKLNEYVLNWMALGVQRPWERPEVALVLRGNEGVGKGVFATNYGKLFGPHFQHVNSTRQVTGNFNAHLANALVVFADEAILAEDRKGEGALKTMITEKTIPLEYKGKDLILVENHVHLIIASNHDWVVTAGPRARRFCMMDVSEAAMQNPEYFRAIQQEMANGGHEALFHMLLHRDIRSFEPRTIPATEALKDMKKRTMAGTPFAFWHSILQRGMLEVGDCEWKGRVVKESLHNQFATWAEGVRARSTETELGAALTKICPHLKPCWIQETKDRKSRRGWDFGDLQACRAAFCRFYGWETYEWEDEPQPSPEVPMRVAIPDNGVPGPDFKEYDGFQQFSEPGTAEAT